MSTPTPAHEKNHGKQYLLFYEVRPDLWRETWALLKEDERTLVLQRLNLAEVPTETIASMTTNLESNNL
jgi:hypothetical protein